MGCKIKGVLGTLYPLSTNPRGKINISSVIGAGLGGFVGFRAGQFFGSVARTPLERTLMGNLPHLGLPLGLGLLGNAVRDATGF